MSELEQALSKLTGIKKAGNGYLTKCPCHDDQKASLSILEAEGKLLIYCFAGCAFEDIIKKLDLNPIKFVDKIEVTHYDYTDASGNLIYQVVRYEPKSFLQRRPNGTEWIWDLKGITPVLYNLPAVLDAVKRRAWVVWVEGEKDCGTLSSVNVVSTTTSGGSSGKWKAEYAQSLIGAKVAIIPDNDEPGRVYAKRVADSLYGYVESIKWIELQGVEAKGDVTDWFALGNDRKKLANLIKNSLEYLPPQAVSRDEFDALRMMVGYLNKQMRFKQTKQYKYR